MIELHHKRRWVLTPLRDDGSPLVDEYALSYVTHLPHNGRALAYCEFNAQSLRAARACPELLLFDSRHSGQPIPNEAADHYSGHGLTRGMSHHAAMVRLAEYHPSFEPFD